MPGMFRVERPGEGRILVVALADAGAVGSPPRTRGEVEQGRAQLEDIPGPPEGLLVGGLHQCRRLGAVGPVELPGGVDGASTR